MAKLEKQGRGGEIGVTARNASRLAANAVKKQYFSILEDRLNKTGLLKLKIQRCDEGVTSVGRPAWEVNVVSYTLKTPLQPETPENIELQKLYPLLVWHEKGPFKNFDCHLLERENESKN